MPWRSATPRLKVLADEAGPDARTLVPALLTVREVFGDDLPGNPVFAGAVADALDRLLTQGARRTVLKSLEA